MEIHLKLDQCAFRQFFRLHENNWRIWTFFLLISNNITSENALVQTTVSKLPELYLVHCPRTTQYSFPTILSILPLLMILI